MAPSQTSSQASLQVIMPDVTKPIDQTLEVACAPVMLPAKIPGNETNTLPGNVILLQEEMNRTMGCLLVTRSSLDAHQWKEVSDFEITLHQNEAKTREAIGYIYSTLGPLWSNHQRGGSPLFC